MIGENSGTKSAKMRLAKIEQTVDLQKWFNDSIKILRAIRVDLNIYNITPPSRLSLGSMLLTEIQAPSVGCVT